MGRVLQHHSACKLVSDSMDRLLLRTFADQVSFAEQRHQPVQGQKIGFASSFIARREQVRAFYGRLCAITAL